ncbi:MAG: hypothetical protein SW833_10365 [Cyanobacteriota bacterium]|nr:hypothetical protein [Cyanobacteriota bacterium]
MQPSLTKVEIGLLKSSLFGGKNSFLFGALRSPQMYYLPLLPLLPRSPAPPPPAHLPLIGLNHWVGTIKIGIGVTRSRSSESPKSPACPNYSIPEHSIFSSYEF